MSAEQPVLETHDLAKRYGRRTWALTGIDLAIPQGGITALVGPNAAGKSTLIKTWIGFERPTRGSVTVGGIDPWKDRSGVLGLVGYVPQSPALYDGLSVDDHLDLAVLLRPDFDLAYARRRLDELGIPATQGAKSLSGGQQAQVAHAVRTDGATALLSSHIVTDVEQACDRLVVLGVGRIVLHDTVADALATHWMATDGAPPSEGTAIGSFGGPGGERLTLLRREAPAVGTSIRPATLEEVVLGYLASGRGLPGQAAA